MMNRKVTNTLSINLTISITLNINGLSIPIKRERLPKSSVKMKYMWSSRTPL